ncbi:hypothetical protein CPB84DRAFT_1793497 [Gymnopilus junonius]|uniref:Uncharacterized protein n=1 Tax=Gymnopilus junonius TaxID=109634 RepID=A0A9P5ND29_GYMJU|nr:hypothetical protein CPB84DRAFT_1793497 [Gymnopilus junonius]
MANALLTISSQSAELSEKEDLLRGRVGRKGVAIFGCEAKNASRQKLTFQISTSSLFLPSSFLPFLPSFPSFPSPPLLSNHQPHASNPHPLAMHRVIHHRQAPFPPRPPPIPHRRPHPPRARRPRVHPLPADKKPPQVAGQRRLLGDDVRAQSGDVRFRCGAVR